MGIIIFTVPVSEKEYKDWVNDDAYIDFRDAVFLDYYKAVYRFNEDHTYEVGTGGKSDYIFDSWREEEEIFSVKEAEHWYGKENFEWEAIDAGSQTYIIIALKED
jgi:hypothetical protein